MANFNSFIEILCCKIYGAQRNRCSFKWSKVLQEFNGVFVIFWSELSLCNWVYWNSNKKSFFKDLWSRASETSLKYSLGHQNRSDVYQRNCSDGTL